MAGDSAPELAGFEVGPLPGFEFVLATEDAKALAVFVVVDGDEVHFCFSPDAWGHTRAIAAGFLHWFWANYPNATRLLGPVPRHNRLALKLAKAVGFHECAETPELILLEIRKP